MFEPPRGATVNTANAYSALWACRAFVPPRVFAQIIRGLQVIVDRQGVPCDRFAWPDLFRKHHEAAAGVPDSVWKHLRQRPDGVNNVLRLRAEQS